MGSTLACSYAFMLPAATAPNAIVKQSGDIPVKFMIGLGFVMNLLCVATTVAYTHYLPKVTGWPFKVDPPYEDWLAAKLDPSCLANSTFALEERSSIQ